MDGPVSHPSSAPSETGDSLNKLFDVSVVQVSLLYKDMSLPHRCKQMTLSDGKAGDWCMLSGFPWFCVATLSPEVRLWNRSLCPCRERRTSQGHWLCVCVCISHELHTSTNPSPTFTYQWGGLREIPTQSLNRFAHLKT